MKNFVIAFVVLLIAALSFTSCKKDLEVKPVPVTEESSVETLVATANDTRLKSIEGNMTVAEMQAVISGFTAEYAKFESEEQFNNFANSYYKLTDDEQQLILNNLPYESLDAYIDDAYAAMDGLETVEGFEQFIDVRSDYFRIGTNEDGEREVEELEMTLHSASFLLNTDRVIQVGENYNKYVGKYKVESSDYASLTRIKTSSDCLESGLTYSVAYGSVTGSSRFLGWNTEKGWAEEKTSGKCKRHRKVLLYIEAFSENFGPITHWSRFARVVARKRGIPCIWYKYKTTISWFNFEFKMNLDGEELIWDLPNSIHDDKKEVKRKELLLANGGTTPSFTWTRAETSATTSGMAGIWLHVFENL